MFFMVRELWSEGPYVLHPVHKKGKHRYNGINLMMVAKFLRKCDTIYVTIKGVKRQQNKIVYKESQGSTLELPLFFI